MNWRIAAIAIMAFRTAVRSRLVAVLLLLLAMTVVLMPRMLQGDGTAVGEFTIFVRMTHSFCFTILTLAAMWAGCAAIAAERDKKLLDLTRVKPVYPFELWFGKWLGISLLFGVALFATFLVIQLQLLVASASNGGKYDRFMVSRHVARPILPTVEDDAQQELKRIIASGEMPENVTEKQLLAELKRLARNKYDLINPGQTHIWRVPLSKTGKSGELIARFKFDVEWRARGDVQGFCRVRLADTESWLKSVAVEDFTLKTIDVPLGDLNLPAGAVVDLAFEHTGSVESAALLIKSRQNVTLQTPGGFFTGNLTRVFFIQWATLILLIALGLTLGVAFSFPVAAFSAMACIVLAVVSSALVSDLPDLEEEATLWVKGGRALVISIGNTVEPIAAQAPLERLTDGERIEWQEVWRTLLLLCVVFPAVSAVFGSLILSRRETAV